MSSLNFNLSIPDELRRFAEEQAKSLGLTSVADYLLELLKMAREQRGVQPPQPPIGGDRLGFLDELGRQIPDAELQNLPRDGSMHMDHYLYGHPKRND